MHYNSLKHETTFLGVTYLTRKASMAGTWAAVAVGVVSTGVGLYQSGQTNKKNKQLANQARSDEEARRAAAQGELIKAQESFNALRDERPGVTFEDWKAEYVKAITDPVLRDNFRKIKKEDFEAATDFAKQATASNIQNFLSARGELSQGADTELTARANELALTADSPAAVKRAMELRSSFIPSGTVRYDSQGRLVEGQRADKQLFNTAYEADLAARDRQFRMTRDLLNDYSNVADRQSEKAKDFLQFASLEPIARGFAEKALQTSIDFQKQDEMAQLSLINQYAAAASGIQPIAPAFHSTAASDQLTAQGISAAIKGIATYASNSNRGSSYSGSTPSYLSGAGVTSPYGDIF